MERFIQIYILFNDNQDPLHMETIMILHIAKDLIYNSGPFYIYKMANWMDFHGRSKLHDDYEDNQNDL